MCRFGIGWPLVEEDVKLRMLLRRAGPRSPLHVVCSVCVFCALLLSCGEFRYAGETGPARYFRARAREAREAREEGFSRARARKPARASRASRARPGLPAPTDESWGDGIPLARRVGKQNSAAPRRLFPAQAGYLPSFPEEDSARGQRRACPRQARTPQRIQAPWLRRERAELPSPWLPAHLRRSGVIAQVPGPCCPAPKVRLDAVPNYEVFVL